MKILKFLFVFILIVIFLSGIGIFVLVKTFDANKFRPQIVRELSTALGRKVDIKNLALSISLQQGALLDIQGLSVADDLDFSLEDFLTVRTVSLGIDLQALFKEQKVIVSSLDVYEPKMTLIRNKDGRFNIDTLQMKADERRVRAPFEVWEHVAGVNILDIREAHAAEQVLKILIKDFKAAGADIVFMDKSFTPQVVLTIKDLDLHVRDFTLDKVFPFSFAGALWSEKKNIKVEGHAQLNLDDKTVQLTDVTSSLDLDAIIMEKLKASLRFIEGIDGMESFRGKLTPTLSRATFGAGGLVDMLSTSVFKDGVLKRKELVSPVEQINLTVNMSQTDANIEAFTARFADGNIKVTGNIFDYQKKQEFQIDLKVDGIDLTKLVDLSTQPAQVIGKLYAVYQADGTGFSPETLPGSLKGVGTLEVKEGVLKNINVLKIVLDKMSMLPGLVEKLNENLPEKYKEILKKKDTVLEEVNLKTTLQGKILQINDSLVRTDTFFLKTKGAVNLDQEISLNADIYVPEDLSQSMVTSVGELGVLKDDTGQIMIPIVITGRYPKLSFFPDLEYLGKKIVMGQGKEELKKILRKALGGDEPSGDATQQEGTQEGQTPTDQPAQEEPSPEEQLIDNVFEMIFD